MNIKKKTIKCANNFTDPKETLLRLLKTALKKRPADWSEPLVNMVSRFNSEIQGKH